MDDEVGRPGQGDHANRRLARNNGQATSTRLWIALLVLGVPALALVLGIGVAALVAGDDYLKKLFLTAMGLIAEMKMMECVQTLFNVLKFAKDADELMKWLVHSVPPRLHAAVEWFMPFVRRVA